MEGLKIISSFNELIATFSGFKDFAGLKINSLDDISRLPITTREELLAWNIGKCPEKPYCIHTTSGSTANNLPIFYSKSSWQALVKRACFIYDFMEPSEKDVILNLLDYGLSSEGISADETIKIKGGTIWACGNLEKDKKQIVKDTMDNIKPTVLLSFPSFIFDLVKAVADLSSIKKVLHSGTFVSKEFFEFMREHIPAKFYNTYGVNEVGAIAIGKSEENFLEVINEGLYLEVLKEDNTTSQEGEGRLLVTDLHNLSTPLIRYFVGDKVHITSKGGKTYLKPLGRIDAYVKISGVIHPVNYLKTSYMNILKHDHYAITLKLTKDASRDEFIISLLPEDAGKAENIKKLFNEQFNLFPRIEVVSEMPRTFTGKIRNFIDIRKY